jgi:hypothetical protein
MSCVRFKADVDRGLDFRQLRAAHHLTFLDLSGAAADLSRGLKPPLLRFVNYSPVQCRY